jgi:hypothetical protein
MHDGRYTTVGEVIAHYRRGMVASATLDPHFVRADGELGVDIDEREAAALESYLHSLDELEPTSAARAHGSRAAARGASSSRIDSWHSSAVSR